MNDPSELQTLGILYNALLLANRIQDRWLAVRQDASVAESECLAGKSEERHSDLNDHIAAVMRRHRLSQPKRSPQAESGNDDGLVLGMCNRAYTATDFRV